MNPHGRRTGDFTPDAKQRLPQGPRRTARGAQGAA